MKFTSLLLLPVLSAAADVSRLAIFSLPPSHLVLPSPSSSVSLPSHADVSAVVSRFSGDRVGRLDVPLPSIDVFSPPSVTVLVGVSGLTSTSSSLSQSSMPALSAALASLEGKKMTYDASVGSVLLPTEAVSNALLYDKPWTASTVSAGVNSLGGDFVAKVVGTKSSALSVSFEGVKEVVSSQSYLSSLSSVLSLTSSLAVGGASCPTSGVALPLDLTGLSPLCLSVLDAAFANLLSASIASPCGGVLFTVVSAEGVAASMLSSSYSESAVFSSSRRRLDSTDGLPIPATPPTGNEINMYQVSLWTAVVLILTALTVVCMLGGMETNMDPMLLAKFKADTGGEHKVD